MSFDCKIDNQKSKTRGSFFFFFWRGEKKEDVLDNVVGKAPLGVTRSKGRLAGDDDALAGALEDGANEVEFHRDVLGISEGLLLEDGHAAFLTLPDQRYLQVLQRGERSRL